MMPASLGAMTSSSHHFWLYVNSHFGGQGLSDSSLSAIVKTARTHDKYAVNVFTGRPVKNDPAKYTYWTSKSNALLGYRLAMPILPDLRSEILSHATEFWRECDKMLDAAESEDEYSGSEYEEYSDDMSDFIVPD